MPLELGQRNFDGPHAGRHQPGLKYQQPLEQRPSPLSILPTDLLLQVFERIPVLRAKPDPSGLSVRAACRWLRDAFDSCNTHLVLRWSHSALLQRLIARTSSLSSLRVTAWENGGELLKLPVPWGQLRVLDLSGWPRCTQFYPILGKLRESGKFYPPTPTTGKLQPLFFRLLGHCSALEELVISDDCLGMGEPDMLPFCSTLRSLRLLEPSNCGFGSFVPQFTALQQLELKGSWEAADELYLGSIAACTGLRQLTLEDVNANMSSLASLTQLTSLHLRACGVLRDLHLEMEDTEYIINISPLRSLGSSLERLIISGDNCITASSLELCLSSCSMLRHLDLSNSNRTRFEDEDVYDAGNLDLAALSTCVLLEYLDLSNCPVTGSMEPLLPCTRLQRLYLRGCGGVTALAPLASLVELDISGCKELRDLSPLTACVSLSGLRLSHCPRVRSLAPLAACTQLQELNLSNCVKVTSLKPIAACTQLLRLNICGCSRIKRLKPLSACKVLELLDLGWCNSLASLEPLRACTSLKRLSLNHWTKPVDLAPLAACPSLQYLGLCGCCPSIDLAPLRSCSSLEKLCIDS